MDQEPATATAAAASRPQDGRARAKRLYACARHIEAHSASETVQETAREVALLALDLLAEIRAGKGA